MRFGSSAGCLRQAEILHIHVCLQVLNHTFFGIQIVITLGLVVYILVYAA